MSLKLDISPWLSVSYARRSYETNASTCTTSFTASVCSLCASSRYTLTEGDFHHLKNARLTHLHIPPPALKIVTIHECDSAENTITMTTRPVAKSALSIFQVTALTCHLSWCIISLDRGPIRTSITLVGSRKCTNLRYPNTEIRMAFVCSFQQGLHIDIVRLFNHWHWAVNWAGILDWNNLPDYCTLMWKHTLQVEQIDFSIVDCDCMRRNLQNCVFFITANAVSPATNSTDQLKCQS